tara:strand:+ start:192 stop:560 length:369 start_codon:yes stop_codon:yes gene_type:complete
MPTVKGQKKTGGRKRGVVNKVPADLKQIMRDKLTPKALDKLEDILMSPDSKSTERIKAIELILAYGHGKPQQNQLHAVEAGPKLESLMVRFMSPGENLKEVKAANAKVIEHLDPDNPKRKGG